jgi:hypothetical protein
MSGTIDTQHRKADRFEDIINMVSTVSKSRDGHRHWFTERSESGFLVADPNKQLVSLSSQGMTQDVGDSIYAYRDTDVLVVSFCGTTERWMTDCCMFFDDIWEAEHYAHSAGTDSVYSVEEDVYVLLSNIDYSSALDL